MRSHHVAVVILAAVAAVSLSACASTYYGAWGLLGKDKADLLQRHVNRAEEKLASVREEYQESVDRLRNLAATGSLEERAKVHKAFSRAVDSAEDEREELIDIADTLERTGEDLFAAWEKEIGTIEEPALLERSRDPLERTRRAFSDTVSALNDVRSDLNLLKTYLTDQASYLRFNQSNEAIDALRLRLPEIESAMLQVDREIQAARRQLVVLRDTMPR